VTANTPYISAPGWTLNFIYSLTTSTGTKQCKLLNSNKTQELTSYNTANPIPWTAPMTLGSYSYFIRCFNADYPYIIADSNQINVTVNSLPAAFNLSASTVRWDRWDAANNQWLIRKSATTLPIYADIINESSFIQPGTTTIPYIFQIAKSKAWLDAQVIGTGVMSGIWADARTTVTGGYAFNTPGTFFLRVCGNKSTSEIFWSTYTSESDPLDNCGEWTRFEVSEQFIATFDCDNNSATISDQSLFFVESPFTASGLSIGCQKPAKKINSWCTDAAATTNCVWVSTSRTIAIDTLYYPLWEDTVAHTVTYYANWVLSGSPLVSNVSGTPPATTTHNALSQFTVPGANGMTHSAWWIFVGWNTVADGSGTNYREWEQVTITANITLFAQWVDPSTLNGCFADGSINANIGTYSSTLIQRINASKFGYKLSDADRNEQSKTFRTRLSGNINKYITNRFCPLPIASDNMTWTAEPTDASPVNPLLWTCSTARVANTYGYFYYLGSENNRLLTVPKWDTDLEIKEPTVLYVIGADLSLQSDIRYDSTKTDASLVIIVQQDSEGNGGNIYIDPTVTHIDATVIADGALMNGTVVSWVVIAKNWITNNAELINPLVINGRLLTYNTRGWSLQVVSNALAVATNGKCANRDWSIVTWLPSCNLDTAASQDLERFRRTPPVSNTGSNTCSLYVTENFPQKKPDILMTFEKLF
jgi:hypothetical protein